MTMRTTLTTLHLVVENGDEPNIRLKRNGMVHISIPSLDNQHRLSNKTLNVGHLCIVLNKLRGHWKIEGKSTTDAVGHLPEFNLLVMQGKVTVINIRTSIEQMIFIAPMITVKGSTVGKQLHFRSTSGSLRIENSIYCENLHLSASDKSIRLSNEASIDCKSFTVSGKGLFIDGKVFSTWDNKQLNLDLVIEKLHVGIDGNIGAKNREHMSDILTGSIKGQVANFGTITARKIIILQIGGTILSLGNNRDDSAHRGFEATKQTRRVGLSTTNQIVHPMSIALNGAIREKNVDRVINLLERGVDPDDIMFDDSTKTTTTPRHTLMQAYREALSDATRIKNPEDIATIRALFEAKCWRRGTIKAPAIEMTIEGDVLDCAQFHAANLKLIIWGEIECEVDAIWTSGFVDITTQKNMKLFGQTKLNGAFLKIAGDLITDKSAKVAIEKQAIIRARHFECAGEWYVEEKMDIRLMGSCNFAFGSALSSNHLFMFTKENCIVSGHWVLDSLELFVTEQFLATPTATIIIKESGTLVSKNYHNQGQLTVGRNIQITTGTMAQAENATITVKDEFKLVVLTVSDRNWSGQVIANAVFIATANLLRCSGKINANLTEIRLMNRDLSQFVLNGDMSVKLGPLSLFGESDNQVVVTKEHYFPGFILSNGILNAKAIIAPGIAIELGNNSQVTLIGINTTSNNDHEMTLKIMLYCGWLHTHPESVINATSDEDDIPQRFICEHTWIHAGTLQQTSTLVNFSVNYLINTGRLTFLGFENHLFKAVFLVGERLVNKTTISSVILQVIGMGTMENCGQITVKNSIAVKTHDFVNQSGSIDAQKISIEYLTSEVTNLSGKVNASMSLSVNATKSARFDFLCTNIDQEYFLLPQEQFLMKCPKQLRIAAAIQYRKISMRARTTLSTSQQIVIDSVTGFPSCIVNVSESSRVSEKSEQIPAHGTPPQISVLVTEKGILSTELLNIQGQCQQFDFTINGTTKIDNLQIAKTIDVILVQGCGPDQTVKQIFCHGKSLELGNLSNLGTYLIDCTSITVLKGSSVELGSAEEEITKVSAVENIHLLGDVQVKNSLLFSSKTDVKPSVNIEGTIMGTATNSTLFHIDGATLTVSGTIHRFETCEAKIKTRLDVLDNGNFHSMQTLSIDGEWITWNGKVSRCKKVIITAWGLLCSGEIITEIDELEIQSGLVFSNIGRISGTLSTFGAPFIFNVSLNNTNEAAAMGTNATKGILDIKALFAALTAAETLTNDQLKQWKSTVDDLIEALMKANNHFQNVSSIKERLLRVPQLARELYNKGVRKLKSLHETFGFSGIKPTDPTKKGIQETGMWSYQSGLMAAGAGYTAMFVESWYNDGAVSSSAGDIHIGSKKITYEIRYCILKRSCDASKSLAAANIDAKIAKLVSLSGNINVSGATANEIIVQANKGAVTAEKLTVDHLVASAKNDLKLGEIKAETIIAKSECGAFEATGKIEADKMAISAEKDIKLSYDNSSKADHKFGSLSLDTKRMQKKELYSMLESSGAFASMQISDKLDLAVTDQAIVLGSVNRSCDLSVTGTSVKVSGDVSAKNLNLTALRGNVSVDKNAHLRAEKDLNMKAKENVVMEAGSKATAGQDVNMTAEEKSIQLTNATVTGGRFVGMDAKQDIKIHAEKEPGQRAKASKVTAGSGKEYGEYGRKLGIKMNAGRDLTIKASEVSSKADNVIQAENNVEILAETTEKSKTTKKKSGLFGWKTTTTTESWTEVDESTVKAGGKNIITAKKGYILSVASNLNAVESNYLHAKKDIKLLDIVRSRRQTTETNKWWGLSSSTDVSNVQESFASHLISKGEDATIIVSDEGNIHLEGTTADCSAGKLELIAEQGEVLIKERILTDTKSHTESGLTIGIGTIGYETKESNSRQDRLPTEKNNQNSCRIPQDFAQDPAGYRY
ncbi:unnamed protein product [Didymodactylos carnosus]|uniref:Uncharacterized protein n=1 Tax=Didymodactylos carnosus TaxID=1234261 RepID=A0A8S2CWN2_9BILA|nr:unnamed protein product [Didymodactylos carnosus]CAF3606541.1 unnamed protein product [Didymodactylos carnosus]